MVLEVLIKHIVKFTVFDTYYGGEERILDCERPYEQKVHERGFPLRKPLGM